MIALRDHNGLDAVHAPSIRALLGLRFAQLAEGPPYDPDEIGYFALIEAGDTLESIERETGCWLVSNPFSGARYGEADYAPMFEFAEEHPACYEVGFIFNDSGYTIVLIVAKADVEPDVLDYCRRYATPANHP